MTPFKISLPLWKSTVVLCHVGVLLMSFVAFKIEFEETSKLDYDFCADLCTWCQMHIP